LLLLSALRIYEPDHTYDFTRCCRSLRRLSRSCSNRYRLVVSFENVIEFNDRKSIEAKRSIYKSYGVCMVFYMSGDLDSTT